MKRALITGINGMDGSHLADFLLEKKYKVFGMERRTEALSLAMPKGFFSGSSPSLSVWLRSFFTG